MFRSRRFRHGAQELEGDRTIVPQIMSEIDDGHATASELAVDAVPIGQGGDPSVVIDAPASLSQSGQRLWSRPAAFLTAVLAVLAAALAVFAADFSLRV